MRVVFVDLETGGLADTCPIIQIASIAVDENLTELASFERKLEFNLSSCEEEALLLNSFDPEIWNNEAVPSSVACRDFAAFLKPFCDVPCISKLTGRTYKVAQLVGHNAATFDGPRLQQLFKQQNQFMPGTFLAWDTCQRAAWHFYEHPPAVRPENLKLATLAAYFGLPIDINAHDALADCRTTLAVYQKLIRS